MRSSVRVWRGFVSHPGLYNSKPDSRALLTYPRWSFGGNRLQIKAEIKVMSEVQAALRDVSSLFNRAAGPLPSLSTKQELLVTLLENEQSRLLVWLFPTDHEKRAGGALLSGKAAQKVSSFRRSYRLARLGWSFQASVDLHIVCDELEERCCRSC